MKNKLDKKYDNNIINALKKLPTPLLTFDDVQVYFEENKRNETIFEHIANKKHHFCVSDISCVPFILKDKNSLQTDKKKSRFRNYVGKRRKRNDKAKYIKIITRSSGHNKEVVTSIYLVKEKVEKRKK